VKDPLDIHAGNKIALVAGATGLIGNEVVRQLLNHPVQQSQSIRASPSQLSASQTGRNHDGL